MIRSKRSRATRRSTYLHSGWQTFARTRLSKSSLAKYHIADPRKAPTSSLRQAYIHTQYNKLRHAGVGRIEAEQLAKLATPKRISEVAASRRLYIDEMVLRHKAPTTRKAWEIERKKMRKKAGLKGYTDSQWKEFSAWYGKHTSLFPFPARRKKIQEKRRRRMPSMQQIVKRVRDEILADIAEHGRITLKPSTIHRQTITVQGRKQTIHRDAKGRFTKGK